MHRPHRTGQQRLKPFAPPLERFAPPIAVSIAQQVEKDDRCRTLPGKQFNPRGSWMNPKLQFLEGEPIVLCDNDFAVENAPTGQLRAEWLEAGARNRNVQDDEFADVAGMSAGVSVSDGAAPIMA